MTAIATTSVRSGDVVGNLRVTTTDVVLSSSYATGGEPVTAADLGLNHVYDAAAQVVARGGANGTATLASGTKTVTDAGVTAASKIRCGVKTPGGTVGATFVKTVTAATSFVLASTSSSDTSTVWYERVEPGPEVVAAEAQTDGSVKIKCLSEGGEVASTTDQTGVTVRVKAWGY